MIQNKALRIATGFHQKAAGSHLRAETGVLPLMAHLELCSQQFFASTLQPLHPSHLIVTSPPDPRPFRATFQASYRRILRGLRVRSEETNAPPLPLTRHLLRGRMIERIVRSQVPNNVLMATSPPIDPTEQLLSRSKGSTFSQLRSFYCSRLQFYRHSVGWASDPNCPD